MTAMTVKRRKSHVHVFDVFNAILLVLFALITLYPFVYVLAGSFNDGQDYGAGGVWLIPREWTTANYRVIVADTRFWNALKITVLSTVIGTASSLLFTSAVAYAMSRKELPFRNFFQWFNLVTMFFGGGVIAYFMIIVFIGLYDSFLVYIIPGLYSVYNMIVISNFFQSVPNDLHEVAVIDGAGEMRIWWKIYMPVSAPVLATVGLWIATARWNNYFSSMAYTRSSDLMTLQYYLVQLIKEAQMSTGGLDPSITDRISSRTVSFAGIVVAIIPILCVYPFLQKHFAGGIMMGSLKN